ncbi:MAG: polyprenyl synthetase family protein [Bdellovibrionota bacterium]
MTHVQSLVAQINESLAQVHIHFEGCSKTKIYEQEIKDAHTYPLVAGGKRIRPLFTLLMAGALGGEKALTTASKSAIAVEMLHTYTLVHDDLPCMDNDDFRRGRATTHKVYGDAKALLVGDGLLALSFLQLTQTNWQQGRNYTAELVEILATAASPSGVIWGQWLDLSLTGKEDTDWDLMEIVHTFKTGVLIAASLEMGLICGLSLQKKQYEIQVIKNFREKIKKAGIYIGLAFQIIDDILDTTKTSVELGKTAGKDENQNKFTAIRILGKQRAQELSSQYTHLAIALIKELFAEFQAAEFNNENNFYAKNLIEQIENLLARPN